ncbi:glycosyltransferase family 2 protein (plasmid) [Nicoliella spurrieriana]|uniref:Glycosyltransferase family 2 protein n=1 Tax=Nicoliella spurrieriana TaxID=2925830 RepID=A0A976RQH2_9LACO|nr:glycosyltransferase family 2 protein [Nicoliella spurrieriana]UQS85945.1 glycosyltransferase family 2 protein [Nicoliella spurrieriana]
MQKSNHLNSNQLGSSPKPINLSLIVIAIWSITMIMFEYYTITGGIIPDFRNHKVFTGSLLIFNQVFVGLFFYYGIINYVIPFAYLKIRARAIEREKKIQAISLPKNFQPRVQLLYTTYNDFIPYAFNECLQQTYQNVQGVILDNSTDQKYIDMIVQFVKVHPDVKLVRDVPNYHAKAGNLDNYLCKSGKDTYDYFVILDSDELLEPDFVEKALKYFINNPNLGVLQANHISGCNTNAFMRLFSGTGNTFWPVQNTVRSLGAGFRLPGRFSKDGQPKLLHPGDSVCIELGHGVMFKRECFDDIGKMPFMVAEDLCTSVEVLLRGWDIEFGISIYGNEQFPVNAIALLIRSSKFCSANFEFIKVYWERLFKTDLLTKRQKLDLLTFTMSTPIFAFEYISLLICGIILPISNTQMGYEWFMAFPALLCYFSQTFPDAIFQFQEGKSIRYIISYEVQISILYGSQYYASVKCTLFALIGIPAKFNVTPKSDTHVTFLEALHTCAGSVVFSTITILACIIASGSSWVLLSFFPGCIGYLMIPMANRVNSTDLQKRHLLKQANLDALTDGSLKAIDWRT